MQEPMTEAQVRRWASLRIPASTADKARCLLSVPSTLALCKLLGISVQLSEVKATELEETEF